MDTSCRSSPSEDAALWLALSQIQGLGNQGMCALLRAFGPPAQIFAAPYADLRRIVDDVVVRRIADGPQLHACAPALEWLAMPGNALLTLADEAYPPALLEIPDPPALLYAKGDLKLLTRPALAIVGSRSATPQGEKNAEEFARALSEAGYSIISGLALGIDGAAHRGALRGYGSTIAVVGTGLDIVYPARHKALAHEIARHGLLLSEFPLGTPSRAQNFPRRNRIISGLALGCLIVEANLQSGSLITARLAAEQGREVFAIPGSIHSPLSKGCHQLIKQGAKLVDSIHDILEELGEAAPGQAEVVMDTTNEPLLFHLGFDPVSLDALAERSGLTSDALSAKLLLLELEGKIVSLPGGRYQRIT